MDVTKSRTADTTRIRADVVVIAVADPPGTPTGPLAAVDAALGGLVSSVIKDGEVTGKAGQVRVLHTRGDIPAALEVHCSGLDAAKQKCDKRATNRRQRK